MSDRVRLTLVTAFLTIALLSSAVLAADSNSGPFKGDTYLKVAEAATGDTAHWKLTTSFTEKATDTPPTTNPWYYTATANANLVKVIYNSTGAPSNNTNFTSSAPADLSASATARAGVLRLRIRARSFSIAEDYNADSDAGDNSDLYDTTFARGYARASLNVTNFTTFNDSSYLTNQTRFMRGETVYAEVKTDAPAWNNTGVETATLTFLGRDATTFSVPLNLTFTDNTYRTNWTMPADADLDNYKATLTLTGNTKAFSGSYNDLSTNTTDLTYENGTTINLNGIINAQHFIIRNNTIVNVTSGNLTIRANGSIIIEAGSSIISNVLGLAGGGGGGSLGRDGASGSGDGGGGGGTGSTTCATTPGAGGGAGYGGAGGAGNGLGGDSGPTYGSSSDQSVHLGSGGGGGGGHRWLGLLGTTAAAAGGRGGNGGGNITLVADVNVTVSGTISVNGGRGTDGNAQIVCGDQLCEVGDAQAASGGGGGGSGGTIALNSSKIAVTGTLSSQGGNGGDAFTVCNNAGSCTTGSGGAGGGGGRVKIFGIEASVTG